MRKKSDTVTLNNTYQATAVTFNDTADQVISAGIDNDIKVWDLRKNALLYKMKGHSDTVTGLTLSPDGAYVVSNSMDNSLRWAQTAVRCQSADFNVDIWLETDLHESSEILKFLSEWPFVVEMPLSLNESDL